MYGRLWHWIRIAGACAVQIIFRILPLNPRIIVFYVHKRRGLCCNPKYILKYMMKIYPQKYKYYWITEYPNTIPENEKYQVVKMRSLQYYFVLSRTKIFITNDMVDESLLKRKGQIYLCTWHGGGTYKKSAFDIKEAEDIKWKLNRWYGRLDYLVLSNGFMQKAYEKSFHMSECQMLKTGMPRSDVFYQDNNLYEEIRQLYQLDANTKIFLYAPTYRYGEYELLSYADLESVLEALEERFGEKWVCFYRMHYFDYEHSYLEKNGSIYNGNSYEDVQEFLCATDVLITDYSSLLWDFTLLRKPCFSFAKNPDKFTEEERSFYLPYTEWPYPKAETVNKLLENIERFEEQSYKDEIERYINKVDNYERGNSTELVVDAITKMITKSNKG